jgi:hypothetical protein
VFLPNASGQRPVEPCDDEDDRRLLEHCGLTDAKPPWDLGPPPQQTARAVRGHMIVTRLRCALAPAARLPCEREVTEGEPVGWPRWRRPLLEQTRATVMVCAQGDGGSFHLAESSLLAGVKLKDAPPGLGTSQAIRVQYRLISQA